MAIRDFQSCDFLLNNGADLRVSPPFDCALGRNISISVTLTAATPSGSTDVPLTDVAANAGVYIPAGTTLVFSGTSVVTTADITLTGTSDTLTVVDNTGVTAADVATYAYTESLVDSVLNKPKSATLTVQSVAAGSITLEPLAINKGYIIPINTELEFTSGTVVTTATITLTGGADVITVEDEGTVVATDTTVFTQLISVYSVNQADSTIGQNELEDRNFRSSNWSTRRITNRNASISVSGVYVRKDPGLYFVRLAAFDIDRVYFELQEGTEATAGASSAGGDVGMQGWATLNDYAETRQNDQNKQISFTLNVDGEPSDYIIA